MGRSTIIAISAAAAALVVALVALVIVASRDDVVADGVRVGAVDVGGMKRDEARALVQRRLAGTVGERVVATFRGKRFVLRPEIARARLDAVASVDAALSEEGSGTVAPRVTFSRSAVADFAGRVARRVDRRARDADIDWHDGKLDRTRARTGLQVRRAQFTKALAAGLAARSSARKVEVPVKVGERPDRNLDDLAKRYPTVIAVDRDAKQLRLYKDLQLEHRYRIAVGKAGLETSAGRYTIKEKIVNPPWHVPDSDWAGDLAGRTIPPGDPQNPLEARWMGFHDGQGIHGTSDIGSLGTAASHGCIRMAVPDVKELYGAVKVGTPLFLQ
jgi:lipoprotein-anchoring transpeptidase ErfK/SrfK